MAKLEAKLVSALTTTKKVLAKVFLCKVLRDHRWTSAAQQGIPPTPAQLADGMVGFWDYATMYCGRCGHVYEGSARSKAEAIKEREVANG